MNVDLSQLIEDVISDDKLMINIFINQEDVIRTIDYQLKMEIKRLLLDNRFSNIEDERLNNKVEEVFRFLTNDSKRKIITMYRKPIYVINSLIEDINNQIVKITSRSDLLRFFESNINLLARKYFCTDEISSFNIDFVKVEEELQYLI